MIQNVSRARLVLGTHIERASLGTLRHRSTNDKRVVPIVRRSVQLNIQRLTLSRVPVLLSQITLGRQLQNRSGRDISSRSFRRLILGRRCRGWRPRRSQAAGDAVRIDSLAWTEQFKDYFRADIRVSLRLNSRKISQEWAIDISNIFNTKNPLFQVYDGDTNTTRTLNQLGFLPIAQYRIEF